MSAREYQLKSQRCQALELTEDHISQTDDKEFAAFVEQSGAKAGDFIVQQGSYKPALVKRADFMAQWELPAGLTCDDVTSIVRRLEALEQGARTATPIAPAAAASGGSSSTPEVSGTAAPSLGPKTTPAPAAPAETSTTSSGPALVKGE